MLSAKILLTSFIAILRLVRYGNVPLPSAGAHFHVLQSHGNRCIHYFMIGTIALSITACLPFPHSQRESPALEGSLKQDDAFLGDVEVILAINRQVLPGCSVGEQKTRTDSIGRFRFEETTYFTPVFMYGDRRDSWSLCFKIPDGTEAVWSDSGWWGGPTLQKLECFIHKSEETVNRVELKSLRKADKDQNYCLVEDVILEDFKRSP